MGCRETSSVSAYRHCDLCIRTIPAVSGLTLIDPIHLRCMDKAKGTKPVLPRPAVPPTPVPGQQTTRSKDMCLCDAPGSCNITGKSRP